MTSSGIVIEKKYLSIHTVYIIHRLNVVPSDILWLYVTALTLTASAPRSFFITAINSQSYK